MDDVEGRWDFYKKCKGLEKEEKIKILSTNNMAGLDRQEHSVHSHRKKTETDWVTRLIISASQ